MPKITDFEPDALAELLASIGKADAKVFADVPVDVLGAAAKALQPKGGGGKKEKKGGDGGEKKDGGKKEKPPADPVKEREKLEKKVIKEGGKKGVEIEGASDMGGLDFFCTTIETPDGDVELLQLSMTAMNANPEGGAEDRKGCSGHVGKMIFSAGVKQLAIVAYVPADKAAKVDVTEWCNSVCKAVDGKVTKAATKADSPHGGQVMEAVVAADADKGKFPLKDKDAAMTAAFNFLRSKGAFPEDKDDSDEECCFGDDAFDNIDDL